MDVIIWAIILGAIFYINKNQRAQAAKYAAKQPRPQQKQMQQIWNSMQNTVQSV